MILSATARRTHRMEAILWIAGCVCLALCMLQIALMFHVRRLAQWSSFQPLSVEVANNTPHEDGVVRGRFESVAAMKEPAVIGRVEIPAIGLVTPLLAGDDSMSLAQGAGHIPGTAVPGGLGTVGIAGHRDTHFRALARVKPGMEVKLTDRSGSYHYRITSTEIVTPDQVSVLNIRSVPGLALITCYPFHYIGSAPKRFVVHAALLSVAPDEQGL